MLKTFTLWYVVCVYGEKISGLGLDFLKSSIKNDIQIMIEMSMLHMSIYVEKSRVNYILDLYPK